VGLEQSVVTGHALTYTRRAPHVILGPPSSIMLRARHRLFCAIVQACCACASHPATQPVKLLDATANAAGSGELTDAGVPSANAGHGGDSQAGAAGQAGQAGQAGAAAGTGLAGHASDPSSAAGHTASDASIAADGGTARHADAAAPADAGDTDTARERPVTLYLAGDSTVSSFADGPSTTEQAGWGQMLHEFLRAEVTIDNRAIGVRTARRFVEEGRLADIVNTLAAGDYVLVQFGTNDSNDTATYTLNGQTIRYYLDPETDFKSYLKTYLQAARSRGAVPVLVTPPPRASAYCSGGNGTGNWAQAMRELGMSENVGVVDLNAKAVAYLKAICPAPSPPDFFLMLDDGTVDDADFQERGARTLASFVADGLRELNSPLF
jgi:lysophospholipase L1-like esterase